MSRNLERVSSSSTSSSGGRRGPARPCGRVTTRTVIGPCGRAGRAPNNCTTFWKIRYFHTSVTFERPSVPQKTQRIWTWGAARIPNPMSFRRYGWPFMS